ncbi:MAG: hypothetical protein V1876_03490, partial [Candidatus Peregrinibacteria bacterium]
MTTSRPLLLGILILALTLSSSASAQSSAGGYRLYERIRKATNQELKLEEVDDQVVTYVTRLMDQEKMIPEGKSAADMEELVRAAFEVQIDDFCEMYQTVFDGCPQAYQTIRDWGSDILDSRGLARDLLSIASGYETGVSGNAGELFTISEPLLNIRHIWRSNDDAILIPEVLTPVRAAPRPEALGDSLFDELGAALNDAGSDAIWRYRYGITPLLGEGDCRDGGGDPELYNVTTRRWCQVEEKLRAIRDTLPSDALTFSPPLQKGGVVLFPLRKLT